MAAQASTVCLREWIARLLSLTAAQAYAILKGMDPTELGRALAARRKPKRFTCARCGKEFEALQGASYCGPTCRTLAWRKREREKAAKARRVERGEE